MTPDEQRKLLIDLIYSVAEDPDSVASPIFRAVRILFPEAEEDCTDLRDIAHWLEQNHGARDLVYWGKP